MEYVFLLQVFKYIVFILMFLLLCNCQHMMHNISTALAIHMSASVAKCVVRQCTSLTHCAVCSQPACITVGRHIGSGTNRQLPREPYNIPRKVPETVIKRNFTFTLLVIFSLDYNIICSTKLLLVLL